MTCPKTETWRGIQQNPTLARWVKEDATFQQLLAKVVQAFGAVAVELNPKPGIVYEPLRDVQDEPRKKPRGKRA